jgi:hypothetical protein
LFTPIKKLVSFVVFPFIYPFKKFVNRPKESNSRNRWNIDWVLKHNNILQKFIWLWLDDSIYSDYKKDFHPTKKQNKFFTWLDKLFETEFFRSWYWAGFRNSSNNLSHLLTVKFTGKFVKIEKVCFENKYIKYELKRFEKGVRPYLEIRMFGYKINVGWLDSGKFEGPKIRKLK